MAGVLSGRLLGRFGAALAVSGGQIVPALDGILGAVHGLDKAQAASIKDIILGETEVSAENIRIFEVK